jgi:ornithine cyclodeaminase
MAKTTRSRVAPAAALIDAATLAGLLGPQDWLAAAECAFRFAGTGAGSPPPLGVALPGGGLHVKAATSPPPGHAAVIKINANLPHNPRLRGLPTIQGVVVVADVRDGTVRALIDSASLTAWRTAAATVLAVRTLLPGAPAVATIVGCGVQGALHAELLLRSLAIGELRLFDTEAPRARRLARDLAGVSAARVLAIPSLRAATAGAAAVICCTTSRKPWLRRAHVAPGAVVAAVGADHPHKRELCADLLAGATLVVDRRSQSSMMGEWHHAPGAARHPPELGEVLRGERRGRRGARDIVVFDSTGFALQDACAVDTVLARLDRRRVPGFRFASPPTRRRRS